MNEIRLKVADLRKANGVTQVQLADYLGVSFQSISKWENGNSLPDITLLPKIAAYFKVSIDYLLGNENVYEINYSPRETNKSSHWDNKMAYLRSSRDEFWNDDYFEFLVKAVWKLDQVCNIIDFGCGYGYLGMKLLPLLPSGSTYTGVDISKELLSEARTIFEDSDYNTNFIHEDVNDFLVKDAYDIAICQALLRHLPNPKDVLEKMVSSVHSNGLVICVETNRPFEVLGTMVSNLSYEPLSEIAVYSKLWDKELLNEGRDYSIGLKLPMLMSVLGLQDIDVRLNDKVSFIDKYQDDFLNKFESIKAARGWNKSEDDFRQKQSQLLKNRGLNDEEILHFNKMRMRTKEYINANNNNISMTHINGTVVTFGRKV